MRSRSSSRPSTPPRTGADPAVRVEAVGTQITERVSWDQGTLTHEPLVFGPAAHLWTRTALRPADVDVALLYDGFTFNCLSWLEALGFCGIGEAPAFLDGGRGSPSTAAAAQHPRRQLSAGRTHGFGFLHEASCSCGATAAGRSPNPRSRSSPRAVGSPAGRCS